MKKILLPSSAFGDTIRKKLPVKPETVKAEPEGDTTEDLEWDRKLAVLADALSIVKVDTIDRTSKQELHQ